MFGSRPKLVNWFPSGGFLEIPLLPDTVVIMIAAQLFQRDLSAYLAKTVACTDLFSGFSHSICYELINRLIISNKDETDRYDIIKI